MVYWVSLVAFLRCRLLSITCFSYFCSVFSTALRTHFEGTMDEPSSLAKPLELNQHSRFIIGSVSEDNSEDEISSLVKLDLLEEKEGSLSPASVSSDTLSDLGISSLQDGLALHMR